MKWQGFLAIAVSAAGLAGLSHPAQAWRHHWNYGSYGVFVGGPGIGFGLWAGPRPYYPPPPQYYPAYPSAYGPAYAQPRPAMPEYYYEVAPGQYVPVYPDTGGGAAYPGSRQAPVYGGRLQAPTWRQHRPLAYVPKPMPKPPLPERLAVTEPPPAVAAADKPAATVTGPAISCDKARAIVSGFGFTDVQARTCTGKEYDFSATRDGRAFEVKLSSLTGELTRVKRQ